MSPEPRTRRLSYGFPKCGQAPHSALAIATIAGIPLAVAASFVLAIFDRSNLHYAFVVAIYAACTIPAWIGLVWLVVVDRSTIPDAVAHPDDSIETMWTRQAAENTCLITFATVAIGATVTSFFPTIPQDVSSTLFGVCALMGLVFVSCYLAAKRRGA